MALKMYNKVPNARRGTVVELFLGSAQNILSPVGWARFYAHADGYNDGCRRRW